MKLYILSLVAVSVLSLTACNDNSGSAPARNDSTSNAMGTAGITSNNLMMKSGLPMSAKQEVPVNSSTGSGSMDISYNKENHLLKYTVNWSGLTDKPTMAHIHGTAAKE